MTSLLIFKQRYKKIIWNFKGYYFQERQVILSSNGFTLIELLVVVLVIGILAAIALPQYQKAVEKSKFTEPLVWLRQIYRAEKMYYLQTGAYDQSIAKLEIVWPYGTKLTPNVTKFGKATLPNGTAYSFNSNNMSLQFSYKGVTIQTPLSTGVVDCYHYTDRAKKRICQNIRHLNKKCGINTCTIISLGK